MRKTKDQKIKKLLQDPRKLYHTQDLAVLWGIDNYKIHKGFYSTVSLDKVDTILLGLIGLHRYGYLSTESVLAKEGLIFQDVKYITLVSDISKRIDVSGHKFLVRQMKDSYLYNETGITMNDEGIKVASVERAVADMLYFNPSYHFDAKNIIDWKKVKEIQNKIGY